MGALLQLLLFRIGSCQRLLSVLSVFIRGVKTAWANIGGETARGDFRDRRRKETSQVMQKSMNGQGRAPRTAYVVVCRNCSSCLLRSFQLGGGIPIQRWRGRCDNALHLPKIRRKLRCRKNNPRAAGWLASCMLHCDVAFLPSHTQLKDLDRKPSKAV